MLNFYKLAEQPFGVTPDPRFLYLSETHREAMASVLYSVKAGRGFTALIAEPGMGKTTVLFNLLEHLGTSARTAFLFQSQDTPRNFLRNLLADLGLADGGEDLARMQMKLNDCLVREVSQGKNIVVMVDEAQNLGEPVLEVVRMLSNFETSREKLMHIILAGQPQLAAKLASPELTQLRQRVSIVARLKPFDASETRAYVEHRVKVAGYCGAGPLFTDQAMQLIAELSGGIPRNINNICFSALSIACALRQTRVAASAVHEVAADLDLATLSERPATTVISAKRLASQSKRRALRLRAGILPRNWRTVAGYAALIVLAALVVAMLLNGSGLTVLAKSSHTAAAILPAEAASRVRLSDVPPTARAEAATYETPRDSYTIIRISRNDNLYRICLADFGRYNAELVEQIRYLNPELRNPRHLVAGQELRIPIPETGYSQRRVSGLQGPTLRDVTSAVEAKP